jgi:cell division protease FtsH
MNTTVKTILIWVLILVAAVGLYNFVEGQTPRAQVLTLTEFLNHVDRGEVSDVVINGSNLTGHLKGNGEMFQSSVPDDYPVMYDRLTARQVAVTVLPASGNTLSFQLPSLLVLLSLIPTVISAVVLVLVIDLSRFVKREMVRMGRSPSPA